MYILFSNRHEKVRADPAKWSKVNERNASQQADVCFGFG